MKKKLLKSFVFGGILLDINNKIKSFFGDKNGQTGKNTKFFDHCTYRPR